MKTLEPQFTDRGFNFTQVVRRGDLAVFHKKRVDGVAECWETVRIGRHNGYKIGGKAIAPAETFPPSSAWGSQGWTYSDEGAALDKMSQLEIAELEANAA